MKDSPDKLIFRPRDPQWHTKVRIVHHNKETRHINAFQGLVDIAKADFPFLRTTDITVTVARLSYGIEKGAPMVEFVVPTGTPAPGYKELRENFDFTGA